MFSQDLKIKPTRPNSYGWTSPFGGFWAEHYYSLTFENLFGKKIRREKDFRENLEKNEFQPELMMMGNFIVERTAITSICRDLKINTVCSEDGFFPHYRTMHFDPLGFAWESSLPRMIFRGVSQKQREASTNIREKWLSFERKSLPKEIKKPFVLWPVQLLEDRVNTWDLNVKSWVDLITNFRKGLPESFQIVMKPHPIARGNLELEVLTRDLKNVTLLPPDVDLKTLLSECQGVAGANSTVLAEARLMFHKPTYIYARSWHTNHEELFLPIRASHIREVPRIEYLENNSLMRNERLDDYTDWYLANLLSRQVNPEIAKRDPRAYKDIVYKLSYESFMKYGEEIFL